MKSDLQATIDTMAQDLEAVRRERDEFEEEAVQWEEWAMRLQEDRDALRSEIERLHAVIEPFARAWLHREPQGDPESKGYQRRLERSLLPFYSCGDDTEPLTGAHLRDAARALSAAGIDMEDAS